MNAFDDRRSRVVFTARRRSVCVLPRYARYAHHQTDHQAPERTLHTASFHTHHPSSLQLTPMDPRYAASPPIDHRRAGRRVWSTVGACRYCQQQTNRYRLFISHSLTVGVQGQSPCRVWDKVLPQGSTLYFSRYPNFPKTQCSIGRSKSVHKQQLDPCSRAVSIQYRRVTDTQTDRHDDTYTWRQLTCTCANRLLNLFISSSPQYSK